VKTTINIEENFGKTVGKRQPPSDSIRYASDLNQSLDGFQKKLGVRGTPRGVYKFKTHEEADEWQIQMALRQNPTEATGTKRS